MVRTPGTDARRRGRRPAFAFTLLELLVVVAIIVLLSAILLPAMRRAREIAGLTTCQSNLSQLAKAWEMYLNEHDDHFFQKLNANLVYGGWTGILDEEYYRVSRPLNPYVGLPPLLDIGVSAKVFCCPADNGVTSDNLTRSYDCFGTSYQTNIFLIGQDRVNSGGLKRIKPLYEAIDSLLPNLTASRVVDPSRLVLMGDYGWGVQWIPRYPTGVAWHGIPGYYSLVFLDGHAAFLRIRKGLFITPVYRIQPFESLDNLTISVQQEEP